VCTCGERNLTAGDLAAAHETSLNALGHGKNVTSVIADDYAVAAT
jgi:hypothetical protein